MRTSTQLKADIARDPDRIDAWLAHAQATPPPARIKANRDKICRLFAAETLEEILADLAADASDWAQKELATLRTQVADRVQGVAAPARGEREDARLRRTRWAWNMR